MKISTVADTDRDVGSSHRTFLSNEGMEGCAMAYEAMTRPNPRARKVKPVAIMGGIMEEVNLHILYAKYSWTVGCLERWRNWNRGTAHQLF